MATYMPNFALVRLVNTDQSTLVIQISSLNHLFRIDIPHMLKCKVQHMPSNRFETIGNLAHSSLNLSQYQKRCLYRDSNWGPLA